MRHVAVVGAGIAGLAAAHALAADPDVTVVVLEGSPQIGGKLRVSDVDGLPVDEGAEQVLARVPEALDLIRAVGLGDEVVHPRTSEAAVWSRGRLRPLPSQSVLGVPADPLALARSGVLSRRGVARAARDLVLPRTHIVGDVSVGAYVEARFGREVVDRLVDPLLGGVYAGSADRISFNAALPQLAPYIARHRTLTGAARAARSGAAGRGPVFATVRGGLGRLPDAVAAHTQAQIRTASTVRAIARTATGYRLTIGDTRAPELLDVDAVVVAVPPHPAARLVGDLAPEAAAKLGGIDTASVAVITLVYPSNEVPAATGSGFLVPAIEQRTIKAVTYASHKWEHLDDPGRVVLRASVGRAGETADLQREDSDLVAAVTTDLADLAGVTGDPIASRITRWGGGLPQYAPGHLDRVATIRGSLPPGLVVCGAAYDGIGVPACIRSAGQAVTVLRQWFRDSEEDRRQAGA